MSERKRSPSPKPTARRAGRAQSSGRPFLLLAGGLLLVALILSASAGYPPALVQSDEIPVPPGGTFSGAVGPAPQHATRRYAVDADGAAGALRFRIRLEPDRAGGLCGVRIGQRSARGSMQLHHASGSRSDYSAVVVAPERPVNIEIYTTGPRCEFWLAVDEP